MVTVQDPGWEGGWQSVGGASRATGAGGRDSSRPMGRERGKEGKRKHGRPQVPAVEGHHHCNSAALPLLSVSSLQFSSVGRASFLLTSGILPAYLVP